MFFEGAQDGMTLLWACTHVRNAMLHKLQNATMPFPHVYTIVLIDASNPAFDHFSRAHCPIGTFATSSSYISTSEENSGLVVLEVTTPSHGGKVTAKLRRHSVGNVDPVEARRKMPPTDVSCASSRCNRKR